MTSYPVHENVASSDYTTDEMYFYRLPSLFTIELTGSHSPVSCQLLRMRFCFLSIFPKQKIFFLIRQAKHWPEKNPRKRVFLNWWQGSLPEWQWKKTALVTKYKKQIRTESEPGG